MAQYIGSCFTDIPEDALRWYFSENKKMFKELLDEKVVFKSLFFQNIYDPSKDERRLRRIERENQLKRAAEEAREERRRRALERGEDVSEADLEAEDSSGLEEEEDEMYYGPPPIPLKLFVDKLTEWFHPFDLCFVYFTRLDRGPIAEPSPDNVEAKMSSVLLRGCVDRDPMQMLYELLDSHPVVKNADPSVNFEDKYILRFYKRIKSYAGRVEGELTLNIPRDLRCLYAAPFSAEEASKDFEAVKILNDCCYEWIQSVEQVLNDITKAPDHKEPGKAKEDPKKVKAAEEEVPKAVDNDVLNEIKMWEDRLRRFEGLEEQLKMVAIERSLQILEAAGNIHAKTLTDHINQIRGLLEEAQDNVKFLSTIRKPTHVLVTSMDFKEMRTTLPNLMNSLRNIWMLSKHFNTDEQICSLLDKITNIILARIRGFVDFKLLHTPEAAERIAKESQSLLTGWDESFQRTRRAIEESGREARWEFSVQRQFSQVHHASKVCSDIAEVANILSQLQCCFTEHLIGCTRKPDLIMKAKQRTTEMTESFHLLTYDAFDPANSHHWKNHIEWFHREVRFVDAESASIAEEVFDHLLLSKLAIDALAGMIKTNYRRDIGRRLLAKVGLIIRKFTLEIQEDEAMFRSRLQNPPIAENLPPISGAIYWSNDIGSNLAQTLHSLSAVPHVTEHKSWPSALEKYEAFLNELHKYKMHRYDEWRYRVSDILDANLTRTLLLTLPPKPPAQAKRYLVNFTTDLSDTLAEVKHLEHLGFTVPEVARNMSLQEGKLTGIATDLRKLVDKYHGAIDSLQPAEEILMLPELSVTQTSLNPGHSRLTWNSMGIKEFITAANQQISSLISKIRQVEILRIQLQEIVDYVANKKLLELSQLKEKNDGKSEMPAFEAFFQSMYDFLEKMYKELLTKVSLMAPLLIKVEEILVATRTQKAPRLASYYHHWEKKLFEAIADMTSKNLEEYSEYLRQKCPQFTIRSLLQQNDVILEPDASFVLDGAINVVKKMIDGTKRFVRFYKGSCIPVRPVYITGYLDRVLPTFYDEISCLPHIVKKVESIQGTLINILKMMFNYLNEWKGYRSVWKFNKDMTCSIFLRTSPTCVDFDEKLLYYYNLRRTIESAVDVKDFRCIRMQLRPLKDGILEHIDEWISTLGKLLEQTAWERLEKITNKIEDYSSRLKELRHSNELERTLVLVSDIWDMSLEFEIDYMDIQERCRTLDMYGIKSEKNIVSLSADLPNTWNQLYVKSKEIYFRIFGLKEKNCRIVMKKVERLAKRLAELWDRFRTEGPSSEAKSLEEGSASLDTFRSQLDTIDKVIVEINEYQRVLKRPLTHFEVFTILKTEFANLEEIYAVFQEMQDTTNRIEDLTCDVYFAAPAKFSLDNIAAQINSLKSRFGDHIVLLKLEARMRAFANYQRIIYLLNNDKLRPRHWVILQEKTGVFTDEEYQSFRMNLFFSLDQSFLEGAITECIDIAQEEARIEDELTVIRLRWDERKFILTREPISLAKNATSHKLTVINQINSLNEEVEQDDAVIETMIHSTKSAHFRPDLEKMKAILAEITAILKTWIATQEDCLVLARVLLTYVSADFREIDDIRTSFEEDFKIYNKLMEEVAKKPIVAKCCLLPERRNMLKDYKSKFLSHKKACQKLIELKQKSLTRLSFLSDQESLILLGGLTGDGDTFQKVIRKILGQGFKSIVFETAKLERDDSQESSMVVGHIESTNGEVLQIYRHVDCRLPTDVWLGQLIEEMRKSIKNSMRRALKDQLELANYTFEVYSETIELISVARFNVLWTSTVERIFASDHPMDEIKNVYQGLTNKVASLCKEVIHTSAKDHVVQVKSKNLLNILLSKRNQLYMFLQKNITSSGDFAWKSSFRLIWRKDHDDIEARQGCSLQKYGYEYQASQTIPIETESTLKAQFAIFSSLHEYKPVYLKGPIYGGKTSCVTELSFRLARYLVFLNLNTEFTPEDMVESLQGLCRANCWAHYDGVDLLHFETLSILTTQLQQINLAQSMNLKEFHLSGKKTQLGLQTGFFFLSRNDQTMHSDGEARSMVNLPPISLSSQFRQVFIQVPDIGPIIQAELLAKGFGSPKSLTNSIIAILETYYKITSPGFRHVPKLTLVREIFSRLAGDEAKIESSQIATAIMTTMKSTLPSGDMDIIGHFIKEHFPEVLNDPVPSQSMESSNNAFEKDEPLSTFENELRNMIEQRKWPVVIGPRCSGKTTAITSAVKALAPYGGAKGKGAAVVSSSYSIFEVNLARHSVQELFGHEDDNGKWNFGIISRFLAPNSKPHVIILVTPISTMMAHNFASMFDRGYFQTDSNHSFDIPPQIRFVFETTDIAQVSPLLLARCSLMYLPSLGTFIQLSASIRSNSLLDTAIKALIHGVSAFPTRDDVKTMTGKLSQLDTIYNILHHATQQEGEEQDEVTMLSNFIYTFCWSFGSTLQCEEDVVKFDAAVRKTLKEVDIFQKIVLLEKCNIFQQKYDPQLKMWLDLESSFTAILEIVELLLSHDKPVVILGELETRLILRALEARRENQLECIVVKMSLGSNVSKKDCLDLILGHLTKQGESHMQPKDDKRLLWIIKHMETRNSQSEGNILAALADIAKNRTIYSKELGFRRRKLKHISMVGQMSRTKGIELFSTFEEINYFNIVATKVCTPSMIICHQNTQAQIPREILDATLEIHYQLVNAFGEAANCNLRSPGKILSLASLDNAIRCMKITDGEAVRLNWINLLHQNLYLPLWTQEDKDKVRDIFAKNDVDIGEVEPPKGLSAFERTVHEIVKAIDAKRKIIILASEAGVGKRASITKSCEDAGVQLFKNLVDPTCSSSCQTMASFENKPQACIINGLLFTELDNAKDIDKYIQAIKAMLRPNLTIFVSVSVSDYKEIGLKLLLHQLRQAGGAIIGIPEWTDDDLRYCFGQTQSPVTEMLLKIHTRINMLGRTVNSRYTPTPAMLTLAYRVTDHRIKEKSNSIKSRTKQLEGVLREMVALDQLVESSERQLAAIVEELDTDEKNRIKMTEDMESTKLTLETTTEQKTALKRQIPDFHRQVDVRQHDLVVSTQKRHAGYEKAAEVLREKAPKDIEKFCSKQSVAPEVEVICSAILVITEGMKYPEPTYVWNHFRSAYAQNEWRQQFYNIDPERHGTVTAFFLERRMKELRKLGPKRSQLAKEEPIADALLEYCEGFLEIINTVEERIELESRLKVYEEMYANMNSEVERLQTTEDNLHEQLKELTEKIATTESKMTILGEEIRDKKGKLQMAQEIANSLRHQRAYWSEQLSQLQSEEKILEERETVVAAASVYLMELSQAQRETGLAVIEDAVGSGGSYSNLVGTFDPCHRRNILNQQQLPGWEERIIKRLCVVYDPHNILIDLFTEKEVTLLYIEELEDLENIRQEISKADEGDTLVLNFGSNGNIIFDVIGELKKMCSTGVSVFLCLSQWSPLPSRVTFVNLEMRGNELRRMALHLFTLKEGRQQTTEKLALEEEATRQLKIVESQLMNIIMSPQVLTEKYAEILSLSAKMEEHRATRRASKVDLHSEMEESLRAVKTELFFPIAVIAACSDMSTIANRPFMSLSQFVNFTWTRMHDMDLDIEEAHKVIFQRYCLAFSDREQLLFHTLIIFHYNILKGDFTEEDFKDFLNVASGHQKKEFPLSCPEWCDAKDWHHLKKIVSEKNYHYATRSLEENEDSWRQWYENTYDYQLEDTSLAAFLIKCALRQGLLPNHLSQFVIGRAAPAMQVPSNLCLDYVHSFSTSISPILLYIDNSAIEDPTFHLKKLADVQGIASTKVKYFALGAGNGNVACSLLDTAFVRGQWLIFQNLQLVPNIIVALQRRIDEAKDIHEDFRLWFTWQHTALPQLQLLQRSIVINCQPIRAIRYHTNTFVYSLNDAIFDHETTKRSIICCLLQLHRRWEWSSDYAPFYWHAAFRMHSTNILNEVSNYADFFSTDIVSTTSGGVRRRITGEQLHDRLTRFLSSIYSHYIQDECDMRLLELEVGEALLTLLVDEIVMIQGGKEELKGQLCQSLVPAIEAPGRIGKSLNLPRTVDIIYNKYMYGMIQRHVGKLLDGVNRWFSVSFSHDDILAKAKQVQALLDGFHGTDYSEDTIYRESIDELVLIREKKEFNEKAAVLMIEVVTAFSNQAEEEWFQQLRTPQAWQLMSGVRNRRLDAWLDELELKVKNFLGDAEPVNLGWFYDPLRYLSAVSIRHLISSNLGTTRTDFTVTLSGIKDIHELKEGLHAGCYANGIYLFGAKWTSNDEGPVPDETISTSGNQGVVQNLGIVSLVPIESDKVKTFATIPLHQKLPVDHTESTFVINLRVKAKHKLPLTSSIKFLLSPNV